jgi:hypothetical protein
VGVPNYPIGDAPREGSPYPPAVPPPHDDQAHPKLLGERDDLLGRWSFPSYVDPGDGPASVLYLLDLLIE